MTPYTLPNATLRRASTPVVVVRGFLALVFITYGVVKIFGGQFYYGDWSMTKATVDGPSLVWSFYGFSPVYGRFIGFCELIPAILLLIPRTAMVGAMALFPVALNITVMDFTYRFPSVRYMALLYTVLLAFLLWTDRARLLALVAPLPRSPRRVSSSTRSAPRRAVLYGLWTVGAMFTLFVANLAATSLSEGPERIALETLATSGWPRNQLHLIRSRYQGLYGVNRTATIDFAVVDSARATSDTLRVLARKALGVTPWKISDVPKRRETP
jgi:hypothetical protein